MIILVEADSENYLNAEHGGPAWPECMSELNTAKTAGLLYGIEDESLLNSCRVG